MRLHGLYSESECERLKVGDYVDIRVTNCFLIRFGYCDDLSLAWEQVVTPVTPAPGSTVELTPAGLEFLSALFEKHDLDRDQTLSTQETISLFSTCPSMPWGPEVYNQVPVNNLNRVGLTGYLAWWNLISLLGQ